MGHPAAPDHEHHRSLWWGHKDVAGVNFWEEAGGTPQIRQERWAHYQDGDDEAGMVVEIGWFDAHNVRLLKQDLVAVLRPLEHDETWLELQTSFTPVMDGLTLGKTNFGLVGLRVAASMSALYGDGLLTNSDGARGERAIFGKPAAWMDYSGPVAGEQREGVTWFDHPSNPNHPTSWHVRDDGWMSAAFNFRDAYELHQAKSLTLRYGFHIHRGAVAVESAAKRAKAFAEAPSWEMAKAERPWRVKLRRHP
jgi:hypothetical protein